MATPIGSAPELHGSKAEDFLNSLDEPLTDNEMELQKKRRHIRFVPF